MINADTVYGADWVKVSIGFAVASSLLCYKLFYNIYLGYYQLKISEDEFKSDTASTSESEVSK